MNERAVDVLDAAVAAITLPEAGMRVLAFGSYVLSDALRGSRNIYAFCVDVTKKGMVQNGVTLSAFAGTPNRDAPLVKGGRGVVPGAKTAPRTVKQCRQPLREWLSTCNQRMQAQRRITFAGKVSRGRDLWVRVCWLRGVGG